MKLPTPSLRRQVVPGTHSGAGLRPYGEEGEVRCEGPHPHPRTVGEEKEGRDYLNFRRISPTLD